MSSKRKKQKKQNPHKHEHEHSCCNDNEDSCCCGGGHDGIVEPPVDYEIINNPQFEANTSRVVRGMLQASLDPTHVPHVVPAKRSASVSQMFV